MQSSCAVTASLRCNGVLLLLPGQTHCGLCLLVFVFSATSHAGNTCELCGLQVTLDFRLELPQVAVIGSQSSGKSSVLEALVCVAPEFFWLLASHQTAFSVFSDMVVTCAPGWQRLLAQGP